MVETDTKSHKPQNSGFSNRLALVIKGNYGYAEFANKVGVSVSGLKKWLSGTSEPGLSKLVAIAKVAGVSLEWLAAGDGVRDADSTSRQSRYPAQIDVTLLNEVNFELEKSIPDLTKYFSRWHFTYLSCYIYHKSYKTMDPIERLRVIEDEIDYLHTLIYGISFFYGDDLNEDLDDFKYFKDMDEENTSILSLDELKLLDSLKKFSSIMWDFHCIDLLKCIFFNLSTLHELSDEEMLNYNIVMSPYMVQLRIELICDKLIQLDSSSLNFFKSANIEKCLEVCDQETNILYRSFARNTYDKFLYMIYNDGIKKGLYFLKCHENQEDILLLYKNLIKILEVGFYSLDKHFKTNFSQMKLFQDAKKINKTNSKEHVLDMFVKIFQEFHDYVLTYLPKIAHRFRKKEDKDMKKFTHDSVAIRYLPTFTKAVGNETTPKVVSGSQGGNTSMGD